MADKILILIPPINLIGGVSGHYRGLQKYWSQNIIYFETAKFSNKSKLNILTSIVNILKYIYTLIRLSPTKVVINVSLKKGFFSKNRYIKICKLFKKKTIIFIHGWDADYEYMLQSHKAKHILSSDGFILLSESFKNKLAEHVSKNKIFLTTTKVDDSLVKDYDISNRTGKIETLLFLSRIEKGKGIFVVLDAYNKLITKYPNLKLSIVGDGTALNEVKQLIDKDSIKNVTIHGRLSGNDLIRAFSNADLFILPTHGEGMPGALLEAMAFGLPIITRPVGGIPDFFKNGEMGILTESLNPNDYAQFIEKLIKDPVLTKKISIVNYIYAKEHFWASIVAHQMEQIFKNI